MVTSINGLQASSHAKHESGMRARIMADQQTQLATDLTRGVLDPRSVRLDPATGLPVFDSALMQRPTDAYNVCPLPVDSKIQPTPLPVSRRDLVAIMENASLTACIVMGIPSSEIGMNSAKRLADVDQSNGTLHATLSRFRTIVSRSIKDIFTALYGLEEGLEVVFPSFVASNRVSQQPRPAEVRL